MVKKASSLLLAMSLAWAGGCTTSSHTSADRPAAAAGGLAAVLDGVEAGIAEGRYPGAVFAVARGDRVFDLQAVGVANIDTGAPMRADSIFQSMSMTKPISAVAAMIMVEEGKLELDAPVARVLPQFASFGVPSAPPLTLRHLLTHTSGIGFGSLPTTPTTLERRVDEIASRKIIVPAGEQWAYSGVDGPDIAVRMIEVASGEPYKQFLQRRIFGPLGMKDTGYSLTVEQEKRLVALHAAGDGKVTTAAPLLPQPSYPSGGAGLYTTAPDYLRFAQMLANEGRLGAVRVLEPHTIAELRRAQLPPGFPGLSPGIGSALLMRRISNPVTAKSPLREGAYGWSGAYGTHFWIDPATGLVAVWMINLTTAGGAGSPDAARFEKVVMDSCKRDRRCASGQ